MTRLFLSSFLKENLLNTNTANWVLGVMKQKPGKCSLIFYLLLPTHSNSGLHISIQIKINPPTGKKLGNMTLNGNYWMN